MKAPLINRHMAVVATGGLNTEGEVCNILVL